MLKYNISSVVFKGKVQISHNGQTVVWLGFHPSEDDKLIGESFALEPSCDGRIIELTREEK